MVSVLEKLASVNIFNITICSRIAVISDTGHFSYTKCCRPCLYINVSLISTTSFLNTYIMHYLEYFIALSGDEIYLLSKVFLDIGPSWSNLDYLIISLCVEFKQKWTFTTCSTMHFMLLF